MKRIRVRCLAATLLLAVSVARADGVWLGEPILLPDSMGGVGRPEFITWNAANNLVYVGGRTSPRVVAFDAGTRTKVAVIDVGQTISAVCANAAENKVYVALMAGQMVAVIDGRTNSVVSSIKLGRWDVDRLCLNPSDNKLYCLHSDWDEVTVVDCRTDAVTAVVTVGKSPSALVCDSTSGTVFCASKDDGTVSVIDGASDSVTRVIQVGAGPQALCPVPSAAKVYCANGLDSTVSVVDCSTMSVRATIRVGNGPEDLCYVPGVNKLYCANSGFAVNLRDSTVTVVDCATDSVVATVNVCGSPTSAAWWPHRDVVFVAFSSEELISAIDTKSDSVTHGVYVRSGRHSFAFASTEGALFCTSDRSGTVTGILSREPQYITIAVGAVPYYACVNLKSGKLYCTDVEAARIAVADLQTNKVTAHIDAPGGVWLCHNTRNNKLYASAYSNSLVYVIDGEADTVTKELKAGPGPLGLCYDSVYNRVYCANFKGSSIEVFDGASDSLVATVAAIDSPIGLAAAPDLRRVYYTSGARKGIFAIDCENNRPDTSFEVDVDNEKHVVCYNPEDQRVYFAEHGMFEGSLLSADAKGTVHRVVTLPGWCTALCYDNVSQRLLCVYDPNYYDPALGFQRKIAAIDCKNKRIVASLDLEPGAGFVTAGEGRAYVVCSDASSIMVLGGLATLGKASPVPCVLGHTRLTGLLDGPVVAAVYDLSGRLRLRMELVVTKGEVAVGLSGLPTGIYYVLLDRYPRQSFKVVYLK